MGLVVMLQNRFYMTYARSRPNDIIPLAEKHNIGLMTNAAHRWGSNGFKSMWDYDCPHIIDSGGYNVQSNFRLYPWSVKEYHSWLSNNLDKFEWAACMDYACEERFDEIHSVKERMEKTLDNTIEHFDLDPEYNLLPVIQGRSVDAYIEYYDWLVDHGIPVTDVGLGTVCRISSSDEIVETENAIRKEYNQIKRIHGFGVKIDAYKRGANFESADSQAWVYAASNGKCYIPNGDGLKSIPMGDNSRKRTVWSFVNYYDHVTRIGSNFSKSEIDTILCSLEDGTSKEAKQGSQNEDIDTIANILDIEPSQNFTKGFLQRMANSIASFGVEE